MKGIEKSRSVAKAVKRAVSEHGAPNSFSPAELHSYYGCPLTPLGIGLSAWEAVLLLNDEGYGASYSNRRFHVTSEGK